MDLLRVFAIFSVMLLHISATQWYITPVNSYNWQIFNILDSYARFGVPVMIMISGMFLLRPDKNISIETIYRKYITRIVTAFIFWSACYAVCVTYFKSAQFDITAVPLFLKTFGNGYYHLWFCYLIIGLYVILPFLRLIVQNKRLTEYFLLLSFLFAIVIPTAKLIPLDFLQKLLSLTDNLLLYFVLGYTFYFVIGYYLHEYPLTKKQSYGVYFGGIIGLVATISLTAMISLNAIQPTEMFYQYLSLNVMLTSVGTLVFFENIIGKIDFSDRFRKLVLLFSECSFGMYLCHVFFIEIFTKIGLTTTVINPVIAIPILAIMVFLGSFCVARVLYHIPIAKKYIM